MPVPNSFANVTTSIPLSQLDANFNTPITLGNTAIQLGNTVTTLNNMTLANVTVTSGNVTLTNVSVTTANVATANVTTSQILNYGTANGVAYLNTSKALTTGTTLVFDGTNLGVGTSSPALPIDVVSNSGSLALSIRGRSSDDIGTLMYYTNNGVTNTAQIQMRPNDNEFRFAALGARSVVFYTNGSERMRVNPGAPILCLSGGNTSATGTGIAFPATQNASSDANTLDDYEEGTFTATLSPGTSGSITLNSIYDLLSYTKIGRLVTITGQLVVSSVSSPVGSLVNLNNLPFPCADTSELSERAGGCTTYIDDSANLFYTQGMLLAASDTSTRIYMSEAGRVAAITTNDAFVFSFSYITST